MGIELYGNRYTYKPSEDSLLLTYKVLKGFERIDVSYDICTGSGIIAIMAAKRGSYVVGTDIMWDALRYALKNSEVNGVSQHIDFILCDGGEALRSDVENILIFVNPPYIPGYPAMKMDLMYLGGEGGIEVAMKIIRDFQGIGDGSIYIILSSYSDRSKFIEFVEEMNFYIDEVDEIYLGGETLYLYKVWRELAR